MNVATQPHEDFDQLPDTQRDAEQQGEEEPVDCGVGVHGVASSGCFVLAWRFDPYSE